MKKLYAEHQVSPFSSLSGCLPALVQMPVLIGLYRGITNATTNLTGRGQAGSCGSPTCPSRARRRVARWSRPASRAPTGRSCSATPRCIVLPLLAAILTFAQSRMMMPPPRPDMTDQERTMGNVTKQMSVIFPMIIFVLSLNFPQGLALYWVTGTLFMVLQQYHLVGWGSLKVPAWFPGAGRVTALSYPKHTERQRRWPSPRPRRRSCPPATAAARRRATRTARQPDQGGLRGAAHRPVATGAVNAPPARIPKRRNNKRRR